MIGEEAFPALQKNRAKRLQKIDFLDGLCHEISMAGLLSLKICTSAPICCAQARFDAPRGSGPHF